MTQQETQLYDGLNSQSQQIPEMGSWAKLTFLSKTTSGCVWLKNNIFTMGKLPDCDFVIDGAESYVGQISKIQFLIQKDVRRDIPVAYITDRSSNGTFVNGELIGKNRTRILGHEDIISVVNLNKNFKFCYLMLNEQLELPRQVKINYLVLDEIAHGRFSHIYYVLNKKTCRPCAMKTTKVSMNIHEDDGIFNEMRILQMVNHKNIIGYHDQILIDNKLYLVLEYMDGNNLNQLLHQKGKLAEPLAQHIAKQIISGLVYLHSFRIVHRNIKPENILLNSNENDPAVKIINFRTSKKLRKRISTIKWIGTSVYDAPETKINHQAQYDTRIDVWSFGVLLYVALSGREPLEGSENNGGGRLSYSPRDVWSQISPFAKGVIEASLIIDPKQRNYSMQILSQPWFTANLNLCKKRPNVSVLGATPKRLKVARNPDRPNHD